LGSHESMKCEHVNDLDLDNNHEIFDIHFAFHHFKLIKLLEERGEAIQNLDWETKKEVDEELKKKFKDTKF